MSSNAYTFLTIALASAVAAQTGSTQTLTTPQQYLTNFDNVINRLRSQTGAPRACISSLTPSFQTFVSTSTPQTKAYEFILSLPTSPTPAGNAFKSFYLHSEPHLESLIKSNQKLYETVIKPSNTFYAVSLTPYQREHASYQALFLDATTTPASMTCLDGSLPDSGPGPAGQTGPAPSGQNGHLPPIAGGMPGNIPEPRRNTTSTTKRNGTRVVDDDSRDIKDSDDVDEKKKNGAKALDISLKSLLVSGVMVLVSFAFF